MLSEVQSWVTRHWRAFARDQGHTWLGHEEINYWGALLTAYPLLMVGLDPVSMVPAIGLWGFYLYREIRHGSARPKDVKDNVLDYLFAWKGMAAGWLTAVALHQLAQHGLG